MSKTKPPGRDGAATGAAAASGTSTTAAPPAAVEPRINANPLLQSYYRSFESRIGYRLLLGGTRHFGYWNQPTKWPFPISASLRRMEEQMFLALRLGPGAEVLDAGCGNGPVAIYMARNGGLRVTAIDVVDRHVARARRNAERAGLLRPGGGGDDRASEEGGRSGSGQARRSGSVEVRKMDYHHLDGLADASLDGVYTCETLVHATDPEGVMREFLRVLRPGGRVVMHEYDQAPRAGSSRRGEGKTADWDEAYYFDSLDKVNHWAAMPTMTREGRFQELLEAAGFVDVRVRDISANVEPMLWLFFVLAYIPNLLVRLLGLERYLINTFCGAGAYKGMKVGVWRYVAIEARKPGTFEGPELEPAAAKETKKAR